ncbi:MAG: hypothetical protein HYU78_00065 [Rhodocyclales bacterium]|nr:hypothetical protein [Rhodocyclales bacterium]
MNVTSANLPQVAQDFARPAAKARGKEAFTPPPAAAAAQEKPAPAKSAEVQGPKAVPPGLEKVQARLQEIAPEERTRGQTNALSSIDRNLARYVEQQAAATASAPEAPTTGINTQA